MQDTVDETLLIPWKEKRSATHVAVIDLRYLNQGCFSPLLRVFDKEQNVLLEEDLPVCRELNAYGTIQLSRHKIIIKPRNNAWARNKNPITIAF